MTSVRKEELKNCKCISQNHSPFFNRRTLFRQPPYRDSHNLW
uniref:Uncharacterized protein n=1 Tax=Arundo donax TaxID=35708 RepID=A0A0A8YV02_ARUDO